MKGLLVKDFQILLQQKRTLLTMVLISVLMLFATSDISFITGYVTIVASFTAIGTISYDEMDNGYTFLFTMPVDRKGYVLGKYILSVAVCVVVWGIMNLLIAVSMAGEYSIEDFIATVAVLVVTLVMQFMVIPLQLKYGAEKSRIVYLLIVGVIILLGFLFGQFSGYLPEMPGLISALEALGAYGIGGIVLLFCTLGALISFVASCRVMEKKQL